MLLVCTVQRSRSVTHISTLFKGFPDSSVGKESAHNAGDPGLILWVGKIPWRRERLPTPVFWSGEFHVLYKSIGSQRVRQDSATFTSSLFFNLFPCRSFQSIK